MPNDALATIRSWNGSDAKMNRNVVDALMVRHEHVRHAACQAFQPGDVNLHPRRGQDQPRPGTGARVRERPAPLTRLDPIDNDPNTTV